MVLFESVQPCLHDIVLTLALFKSDQIDFVIGPKLHDRFHKGLSHLCDLLGGGKAIAQMPTHEASLAASATLEKFHEPARKAGVSVVPSVAFYGGLPDLMATAALGQWDSADSIEILIGLDSWHPTTGTRITIGRIGTLKVFTGGRLVPVPSSPTRANWDFGSQLGNQTLVEVPFSEMALIPRHVKTPEVRTYLNSLAVSDVQNPATPKPKAADATGRSRQRFVIEVEVRRGSEGRRAIMRGRDIYAITAPLVCEAAEHLLKGKLAAAGAYAPGEIFEAKAVLAALGPDYPFEIVPS